MIRKLALTAALAVVSTFALTGTASAAVTCNLNTATLEVDITAGNSFVMLTRGEGPNANSIIVATGIELTDVTACSGTPATITNTDSIQVDETGSGQGTVLYVDLRRGDLTDGSDEIEINYLADTTGTDRFNVGDPTNAAPARSLHFGDLAGADIGANLNGAAGDDVDVTATNVDSIFAETGGGQDTITADGSGVAGTTGPIPFDVSLSGLGEDDTIVSGNGSNNILVGGAGDDTMTGGPNGDSIQVGSGDDTANGGGGPDFASYINHNSAVAVDLRDQGAPQDTGGAGVDTLTGFESLIGGNAADTLIGDAGPNSLVGGQLGNDAGADELHGHGDADFLSGAPGDDVLYGGQGNDQFIGAEGNDTIDYSEDSTGPVAISLDPALTNAVQVTGGAGSDTLADSLTQAGVNHEIENITGSGFAGDTLTGNAQANRIRAYDGGNADTVNCVASGDGDLAVLDETGTDTVSNCETSDTAPRTSIASGPADGAQVNDKTPTYDLAADEPAEFEVRIDNGIFVACSDPCTIPSLGEGAHTLRFRAIDLDGNDNPDPTPVTRTLTIDTVSPTVAITDRPGDLSSDTSPEWTFSSAGNPAKLECRVDGGAFAPCSGATSHSAQVADGQHAFAVRATDQAGNASTATDDFAVDATAPDTEFSLTPKRKTTKRKVRFGFVASGAESYECKLDRAPFAACTSPVRTKRLKPGKHKFAVRATDALGNVETTPATHAFKVKRKKRR